LLAEWSGRLLARDIDDFAKERGCESGPAVNAIRKAKLLGQSLSGFNESLLGQKLDLFLPPVDPNEEQQITIDDQIWEAMGRVPQALLPLASSAFLPVRSAKRLKLTTLKAVDAFGREESLLDEGTAIVMPVSPRLAQGSRLNFNWASADPKHPEASPVCGWIVPNYLEMSLDVFGPNGESLGALESQLPETGRKTISAKTKFFWRPSPGSNLKSDEIPDPQLRTLVNIIVGLTPAEGSAFLGLINRVLQKSNAVAPAGNPLSSILLGRPLAVAQATLEFELDGLPEGYWSYDDESKKWSFNTGGIEKLRVPVKLGGAKIPQDGLVGYFVRSDEPPGTELPKFFATNGAPSRTKDKRLFYEQSLSVPCVGGSTQVILFMDAAARVHAVTDVLPRHSVELPLEAVHQASRLEEFFIRAAPVLCERTPDGAPTMPRPSDAFGHWSWAQGPELNQGQAAWKDIRPADDRARFSPDLVLTEGFLKLSLTHRAALTRKGRQGWL
jgi:hypothetical protein